MGRSLGSCSCSSTMAEQVPVFDLTNDSDDEELQRALAASRAAAGIAAPAARPSSTPSRKREVLDLTLDDSDEEAPPARKAARTAPRAKDAPPPWVGKNGVPRLMAEFRCLREWDGAPHVYDAEMVRDDATLWRFKVKDFDAGCKAGRDLNGDLEKLGQRRGSRQDYVVMEISFPRDYPHRPFFLRCVSPRFHWYTGHVTAGGAICIEALTTSGGPGQWSPTHCVEGILNTVFANMLHCEVATIRTATGPGGRTGPLRVDLNGKFVRDPLAEYSVSEAKSAFDRMLNHHAANGW